MVNNGYDRQLAMRAVESGYADIVAFGKAYISNPDLVHRLHDDLPLNEWDSSRFMAVAPMATPTTPRFEFS